MKIILCSLLVLSPAAARASTIEFALGSAARLLRGEGGGPVPPLGQLQFVSNPAEPTPQPAHDWKFMKDGKEASFREAYKDKVVLIDFWFVGCGPCRAATPGLVALHKKYAEKGLTIIALNVDDGDEKTRAQKYFQDNVTAKGGYTGYFGAAGVAQTYGVTGYPTMVLIGADGNVISTGHSAAGEAFEKSIEEALGKIPKK